MNERDSNFNHNKENSRGYLCYMKQHWDARYRETEFAYGETPNVWVKDCLSKIEPDGTLLFPAEGEGRNSVYAETLGWKTKSFDMSEGGKEKALKLARHS